MFELWETSTLFEADVHPVRSDCQLVNPFLNFRLKNIQNTVSRFHWRLRLRSWVVMTSTSPTSLRRQSRLMKSITAYDVSHGLWRQSRLMKSITAYDISHGLWRQSRHRKSVWTLSDLDSECRDVSRKSRMTPVTDVVWRQSDVGATCVTSRHFFATAV